jgi:hypothetical protein
MRGFYSGLIGGFFAGIWIFVYVFLKGGWSTMPNVMSLEFLQDYFIFQFGMHGIFGCIFGVLYSKVFYNAIPSKGFKKGLVYGLLIGMWANLFTASNELLRWSLTGLDVYLIGVNWIEGFLKWIPYGFVLGIVYERLKL